MPMTAAMAPYTLFILDDDTPLNPRDDHDCLGKMVCWHSRYSLGEKQDYDEPSDFLRSLLFMVLRCLFRVLTIFIRI